MLHYATLILQIIACGFIAANAIIHLNRMTAKTAHIIRAGYIALAGGSVSGIASCFLKWDIFDCLFAVGVALFLIANRKTLDGNPGPIA